MVTRLFLSVLSVVVYGWVNFLLSPVGTILSGQVAGKQFEPSDTSYIQSVVGIRLFSNFGIPAIVLVLIIAMIWAKYIRKTWVAITTTAVLLVIVSSATPVHAYYDKTDWPEIFFILPNQSAFWVPDVGDNKTSQKPFMSQEYLREQKIAAKRFQVQHVKLPASAYLRDYFVPAGRLMIVDRTPQAREWVAGHDRGTSAKNESFPCQSSEGINMSAGISLGVSVLEDNAHLFLYRFGIYQDPKADLSKPEVQFQSVYWGRSLSEVTDYVVRKQVLSLVCSEFTKRTFDKANAEMPAMMADIQTGTGAYLKSVGITLDFIGWADTIGFDHDVQKAVNDAYIAKRLEPHMATLTQLAKNRAVERWDGKLPWWMPTGLADIFDKLFGSSTSKK